MEKKSNIQKRKLEINSLEHLLLEELFDQELEQIKGGSGLEPGRVDISSLPDGFVVYNINIDTPLSTFDFL